MERDMDMIRTLLLEYRIGKKDDDPKTQHHLRLIEQAGLAKEDKFGELRLTWQGHEFRELVLNSDVWKEARRVIRETVRTTSFDSWLALLRKLSASHIMQHADLKINCAMIKGKWTHGEPAPLTHEEFYRQYMVNREDRDPAFDIKAGDIVGLKTGSPPMTVSRVLNGKAQCCWFSEDEDHKSMLSEWINCEALFQTSVEDESDEEG